MRYYPDKYWAFYQITTFSSPKTHPIKIALCAFTIAALLGTPHPVFGAGKQQAIKMPDLTKGEQIPAGATHDWNLGATGARGWIYSDRMVTIDARQIAITKVDKNSPADGTLVVGDVILGVSGNPFS